MGGIIKTFSISGVPICALNKKDTIEFIDSLIGKENGYICLVNIRAAYLFCRDESYNKVQASSLLSIADGTPISWIGKTSGIKNFQRFSGPELLETYINKSSNDIKHFFLGETVEVLSTLQGKLKAESNIKISGFYSPEFIDLSDYNFEQIAEKINKSDADIVWIALGSPKQDFFAHELSKYTKKKILINVGAAFRYVLGYYNMPSNSLQKAGLTGVYWRFRQKPLQFLKLYPVYFWFILKQLFKAFRVRFTNV